MALIDRLPRRGDRRADDRPRARYEPGQRAGAVQITSLSTVSPLRAGVDPDAVRTAMSLLSVGVHSPFATSTRTHFARLQVLDEVATDERRELARPLLVLSADVDGDPRSWLLEVLAASRDQLAPILACCDGAPVDLTDSFPAAAADYLLRHRLGTDLQYANSPGRSVLDVRWALLRHRQLAGFVVGHQDDDPDTRRQAFLRRFAPRPDIAP